MKRYTLNRQNSLFLIPNRSDYIGINYLQSQNIGETSRVIHSAFLSRRQLTTKSNSYSSAVPSKRLTAGSIRLHYLLPGCSNINSIQTATSTNSRHVFAYAA